MKDARYSTNIKYVYCLFDSSRNWEVWFRKSLLFVHLSLVLSTFRVRGRRCHDFRPNCLWSVISHNVTLFWPSWFLEFVLYFSVFGLHFVFVFVYPNKCSYQATIASTKRVRPWHCLDVARADTIIPRECVISKIIVIFANGSIDT